MRLTRNLSEGQARSGGMLVKFVGAIVVPAVRIKTAAKGETTAGDLDVSGVISRYGIEDSYGDVFLAGAFDPLPDFLPMLRMHRRGDVIGKWVEIVQDGDDVRAAGPLWSEAGIVQRAVRENMLRGLSVGAFVDEFTIVRREDGWLGWDIKKARLVESSIVDSPANPAAELDEVKSAREAPAPDWLGAMIGSNIEAAAFKAVARQGG